MVVEGVVVGGGGVEVFGGGGGIWRLLNLLRRWRRSCSICLARRLRGEVIGVVGVGVGKRGGSGVVELSVSLLGVEVGAVVGPE